MGGVDKMDNNIDNYIVGVRSKKWWCPIFAFCVDAKVYSAWQLHRKSGLSTKKKLDFLGCRRYIAVFSLENMKPQLIPMGNQKHCCHHKNGSFQESALIAKTIFWIFLRSSHVVGYVEKM